MTTPKLRDWIAVQRGQLDFKQLVAGQLKDEDYIRALTLCLLHKKEPYIDGQNILIHFRSEIEQLLIKIFMPNIEDYAAVEGTNFTVIFKVSTNPLLMRILIENLYSAFFFTSQLKYSNTVDYVLLQESLSQQAEVLKVFSSVDDLWLIVQIGAQLTTLKRLLLSKNDKDTKSDKDTKNDKDIKDSKNDKRRGEQLSSLALDVEAVINYGFEPLLRLVGESQRDVDKAKFVISNADLEERPYLIKAFEAAWAIKLDFEVDRVAEAIKISDHQLRRPGIVAPVEMHPEALKQLILGRGAEAALLEVLAVAQKSFPQTCINEVLAVSQEPVWQTPLPYLHFISDKDAVYVLDDADVQTGFNAFTRKPLDDCQLKGCNHTYVEVWSHILDRNIEL